MTDVGQTHFTSALLDPTQAAPAGLIGPDGQGAGKRFDVYRNNVAVSLTEALVTAFPALHRQVGDEFFRAMAGVYLRQHPPKSALMMHYGDDMPAFLEGFEPVAHLGYLPDLARLELARRQSYHAADANPFDPSALQTLAPEALMKAHIGLAPAVRLVVSKWPIYGYWRYTMEGAEPVSELQPEDILVSRPEYDPVLTLLPPGGGTFIRAIADGQPFGGAVDAAQGGYANFDLTATLGVLIAGCAITTLTEGDVS